MMVADLTGTVSGKWALEGIKYRFHIRSFDHSSHAASNMKALATSDQPVPLELRCCRDLLPSHRGPNQTRLAILVFRVDWLTG